MTPAENILSKLGMNATALSKKLGLNHVTVYKWTYGHEKHGTGGMIPYKYHQDIKKIAEDIGVELEATDFVAL